jgi:hypothetical protein
MTAIPPLMRHRIIIDFVIGEEPRLTHEGIGTYRVNPRTAGQRHADFVEAREELYSETSGREFAIAHRYLAAAVPLPNLGRKACSSYSLKHDLENLLYPADGYTCNGVFIAAAIWCGFDWRKCDRPDSVSVLLNLDEKALRAAVELVRGEKRT